jgi:predicted nucleotidyltransferase component of viral defense system
MISRNTIEQLMLKYQTDETTIIREYFQHLFLSYFYQEKDAAEIYFKGGTALRLIYNSPRFSEDLDFSANVPTITPIENAVLATLEKLGKEGITTDVMESTPTSGGYIGIVRLGAYNVTIPLHIEVSLRKGKKGGETVTVTNEYIPSYSIIQLNQNELLGEKITALLTRKKPRDFYDFYFLLRSNLLPEKNRETFESVMKALHDTKINFDSELKAFLPKSHHMIVKDFKATLERELKRYI